MISKDLEGLIQILSKLPGLGPRSARRMVLHLIKHREKVWQPMIDALSRNLETLKTCSDCGNIDTCDPCLVCQDTSRQRSVVCVVADVADLWAIERTGAYKGLYHVLGGHLSAIQGMGPDQMNFSKLHSRIIDHGVSEVILALNSNIEGQITAHYIHEALKDIPLSMTKLAQGVPLGGELDYLDDGTLSAALDARQSFGAAT